MYDKTTNNGKQIKVKTQQPLAQVIRIRPETQQKSWIQILFLNNLFQWFLW